MVMVESDPREQRAESCSASDSLGRRVSEMVRKRRRAAGVATGRPSHHRPGVRHFAVEAHAVSEQDISTPPAEPEAILSESQWQAMVPTSFVDILSRESSNTNVFKRAVDDLMDIALALELGRRPAAPCQPLIDLVADRLQERQTSERQIQEIKTALKMAWLRRAAKSLGSYVANVEEMRTAIEALEANAPVFARRDSLLSQPAIGSRSMVLEARDDRMAEELDCKPSNMRINAARCSMTRSCGRTHGRIWEAESLPDSAAMVHVKTEPSMEDRPDILTRSKFDGAADRATDATRKLAVLGTECHSRCRPFSNALHTFSSHVWAYCSEFPSSSNEVGGAFNDHVEAAFNALSMAQKAEWERIGAEDRGNVNEVAGRQLLVAQGTAAKMKSFMNVTLARSNSRNPPELEIAPIFIPFVGYARRHRNAAQKVQFFADTPDTPSMDISEGLLHGAFLAAFDHASSFRGIEKWNANTWIATFSSRGAAEQWEGKSIHVHERRFDLEGVGVSPPRMFISDFTDIDVNQSEVVSQVSRTFSGRATGLRLYYQESRKLYHGRQYVARFSKNGAKWARFYIPMRRESSGTHMASFKPVSKYGICILCGYKHNGQMCEAAEHIPLPGLR